MPANHCIPHTEEAKAKMRAARLGKPAPWKQRPTKEVDGITHYRCGRCQRYFPRSGFYADRRTTVGLKSECKKCHTATSVRSRDPENTRKINVSHMRRARAADLEKFRQRDRIAAANRPKTERTAARLALNAAVRSGRIVRPSACEACAIPGRVHGHHVDYARPLDVRWLCPGCHGLEHRK